MSENLGKFVLNDSRNLAVNAVCGAKIHVENLLCTIIETFTFQGQRGQGIIMWWAISQQLIFLIIIIEMSVQKPWLTTKRKLPSIVWKLEKTIGVKLSVTASVYQGTDLGKSKGRNSTRVGKQIASCFNEYQSSASK